MILWGTQSKYKYLFIIIIIIIIIIIKSLRSWIHSQSLIAYVQHFKSLLKLLRKFSFLQQ